MRLNQLLSGTSLPILLDAEGEGSGGAEPPAAPSAAPPSLLGDGDAPTGDGVDGDGAAADDPPADDTGAADDPPADDAADEGEGEGEGEGDEAPGAPEAYDFAEFLTDEGVQFDQETLAEFEGLLREKNATQEEAVRFMGVAQKLQDKWLNQLTDAHVASRTSWREAAKSDPTFGGEKFAENLAIAKEARQTFGDEELGKLLDETGIGDHPAVIRAFYNVGVVNREHGFVKPGKPEKPKSFYDHPTSQPKG